MRSHDQHPISGASRATLYQEVTDRVVRELEQGRIPWVQPWDGARAGLGLPSNAVSGRRYSGINILILWDAVIARGFGSQAWLTFPAGARAWRACAERRTRHDRLLCRPLHPKT